MKTTVCHSFAIDFIKRSLQSKRVSYRNIHTDKVRLAKEYQEMIADWDSRICEESKFSRKNKADLVVSDISPIAFEAAARLGIPSIGVFNFTWSTAYQGLLDEYELKSFKEAYQKITYFFSLVGGQEKLDVKTKHYGFFSREIDGQEVQRIKSIVNSKGNKRLFFRSWNENGSRFTRESAYLG